MEAARTVTATKQAHSWTTRVAQLIFYNNMLIFTLGYSGKVQCKPFRTNYPTELSTYHCCQVDVA